MINKPLHLMALVKAVAKKAADAARDQLTVGRHEVDLTVRLVGHLQVFEDTEKTPTVSIPMKETLALFVKYSGITGPHAMNVLRRAMTEALAANDETDGEQNTKGTGALADALPFIDEVMATVVEPMLASLPKTPVKGQCRAYLDVAEVDSLVTA